jgi:hypothetical protein
MNNRMCLCCGETKETIRHLFTECENETIQNIRSELKEQVNWAISRSVDKISIRPTFVGDNPNQDINKWDNYLGSLDLIPKDVEKELKRFIKRRS